MEHHFLLVGRYEKCLEIAGILLLFPLGNVCNISKI